MKNERLAREQSSGASATTLRNYFQTLYAWHYGHFILWDRRKLVLHNELSRSILPITLCGGSTSELMPGTSF